jgi:hypothetical protein
MEAARGAEPYQLAATGLAPLLYEGLNSRPGSVISAATFFNGKAAGGAR